VPQQENKNQGQYKQMNKEKVRENKIELENN